MLKFITPSLIFHMERMDEFASFLKTYDCDLIRHSPHSTKAKVSAPGELESRVIDRIRRLYIDDFSLYGYSENPEFIDSLHPVNQNASVSSLLTHELPETQSDHNLRLRVSLLFEDPFLDTMTSLRLLTNYSIAENLAGR